MSLDRFDWLALRVEEPIDADRPIIDPHHHLWDRGGSTYLVDQLHADTGAGHNVVATVFVECMAEYHPDGPEQLRPVGETAFVAEQAARSRDSEGATISGIVSFADLQLGDAVEDVLLAHEEAGAGLFRGIRHASGWHASDAIGNSHTKPPEHLLLDAEFRRGFARLGAMGYSFDAWLYHPNLPELLDLVRAHPEVPVVLDHIGAPMGIGPYVGKRAEVLEEWRPSMRALAACPNVTLKVGGIGMDRYYGGGWAAREAPPTSAELADYWGDVLVWCIDTFGPSRCMFESNFPVDRESCSYTVLWNVYQQVADRYSDDEQHQLFYQTAADVYRLDL